MFKGDVDALGRRIYTRSINPLLRCARYTGAIVGFDTEYESKGHKLLSYQLWHDGRGVFVPAKRLTIEGLIRDSIRLLERRPDQILLVAYFSLAELQHLDVKGAALMVREFARGSLDVAFIAACYKGIELEVFDLARWYDFQSLAKAAEAHGLAKMEWDRKHVTRAALRSAQFRKYAIHDAKVAYEIAVQLRGKFLAEGVDIVAARTPAAASASVFRLRHCRERWYCDVNRARLAACYGSWGGRAEAFKRGRFDEIYSELDIRSAYPSACVALGRMPVVGCWRERRSLSCLLSDRGGFARVRFEFRDQPFPCLPVAGEEEGSVIWPSVGETWATVDELRLALKLGGSLELVEGWGYRGGTTALADYMTWCLAERAKATGAGRHFYKLLANSLIGKFIQRSDRLQISKLYELAEAAGVPIDELVDMSFAEIRILAQEHDIAVERFSLGSVWMPEWNGLITGYVRAQLGAALAVRGAIYCHTDSIWTAVSGERAGWDVKRSGRATVARTRFAALWSEPPHVVHHAVWRRAVAEQMLKRFDGSAEIVRKYPVSRPLKYREAVKRGDVVGRWIGPGDAGYWHRADTRWDGKRRLLADGSTEPWRDVGEFLDWRRSRA